MRHILIFFLVCVLLLGVASRCDERGQNWTHYVRIGAYGLNRGDADQIVRDAERAHVFGIEIDNDITGRYESYLDPTAKLKAIQAVAEAAHRAGNKAFVYIAGTECITAHADKAAHSVVKDHPEWLQRKITGEPAVFTSGAAFWISPGDEDVWISPLATDWRKIYMQRVRQIAQTGIDGIYVDIPYWMTHFDGWENTWASFDNYTVAAFRAKTGLDARKDLQLGNFSDPHFRQWIDFRIETLTNFVREIRDTARAANPAIMIIPEIYPGIESEAVRVGADVYQMYDVVDAIAHEYEFGEGDHMASSRSQLDWFLYQAGMLSFRAFAQGKATWILNYSWDGDKGLDPREAMKNLAMSQLMAGANVWDAPGPSMAGSNDLPTRTEIFKWIAQHEKVFYRPRIPMYPVGVYFSPASRNYSAIDFLSSYQGVLLLLLQNHIEFQVVTPRTLAAFHGDVLVLPSVTTISDTENSQLRSFAAKGRVVITGVDATMLGDGGKILRLKECPGKAHLAALREDFARGSEDRPNEFLTSLRTNEQIFVDAPPAVATNIASVEGSPHVFFANFSGLVPHANAVPTAVSASIAIATEKKYKLKFLPFLGEVQELSGQREGSRIVFALPKIERGAVAWLEEL
jgi:hypothetical protein